jgi:zinc transporter ZupT
LTRVVLAIVAAAISTIVEWARGILGQFPPDFASQVIRFLNGLTIALLVYLVTYYVFKAKFRNQVEKQSKIMTMGIGVYFFTWLVVWILTYTIVLGPVALA